MPAKRRTAAEKRANEKSLNDYLQVHAYTDALVGVWKGVEMYINGLSIMRRGKPILKSQERFLKTVVAQAEITRDAILAAAPKELQARIKSAYKLYIKEHY